MNKQIFNAVGVAAVVGFICVGCGGSSTGGGNGANGGGNKTASVTPPIEQAATNIEQTYAVTFDAKGGTVTPATGTTGGDGKLASLPTPTQNDHVFNGWYTSEAGGTAVTTNTVFSANATIYAQWAEGFTDNRDGKTYKKVTIGTQTWMAENLNYDVPDDTTDVCYEDNPDICSKYGRLYTWDVAKKACPVGWHLPRDAEWTALVEYAGGDSAAGKNLRAATGWPDPYSSEINHNGTDDYGFSALPGGFRNFNNFGSANYGGVWWSATKRSNGGDAWYRTTGQRHVNYSYDYTHNGDYINRESDSHGMRFSVRCVQDGADTLTDTLTFTDSRDNKVYKKVTIGKQTWMAENLNYAGSGIDRWTAKCYGNDSLNCAKYGRLYTWNIAKRACPADWHLPSDAEWTAVADYLGGSKTAGKKLKSTSGWKSNGNGTDEYGFSALPGGGTIGGGIFGSDPPFSSVGELGVWWSATEINKQYDAVNRRVGYKDESVTFDAMFNSKSSWLSVRCVED